MMDLWLSELEERRQAGTCAYKEGEKYRVMWDGLACWSQLRYTSRTLRGNGALMVSSNYTYNWNQQFEPGNLESFARAYTTFSTNTKPINQIKSRANIIKNSHAEGVLYHINRSCKLTSLVLPQFARQVQAETGVPYVMFDGDQTDSRVLSAGQFETRLQALTEIMDQNKEAAES